MKKTIQSVLLACIALAILITGCAPAPIAVPPTFTPSPILPTFTPEPTATATQSQITIIEAPGNLESTQEIGCAQISDLKNTHTPADLYNGMVECMNQDNYSSAAFFFFLAGAYGYYDSLRVADTTAHDAISILIEQTVSSVDNTQKDAVGQELQNMTGNADKLLATCTEILRIGAPQYYPHYMIQHGMNAITGSNPDDDLVKNFDSVAAWKQTLDKYLHCPNPTP